MKPLGKLPARLDARIPLLRDRVALIPDVPDTDWTVRVKNYPMLANDQYGDCAWAAAYHMIQTWQANAWGSTWEPTDALALRGYATTGFDPTKPETDRGTYLDDMLAYWGSKGLPAQGELDVAGYVRIQQGDWHAMRAACYWFGGALCGALLTEAATYADDWLEAFHGTPDGGHAFNVAGTKGNVAQAVTWGAKRPAAPAFFSTNGDETFAVVSNAWLDTTGRTPVGLSKDQLAEDMALIRAPA